MNPFLVILVLQLQFFWIMIETRAKELISDIHKTLMQNNLKLSNIERKQYNFEFTAALGKDSVKIQVYFGKKGVKKVIQGNANSELYKKVESNINLQQEIEFKSPGIDSSNYIGSDESGKGDVFGPLVIAAFYCDKSIEKKLISFGVRDSKELSALQIDSIAGKLKKNFSDRFSVSVITPAKYNSLYSHFKNLNKMLNDLHQSTIQSLLSRHSCQTVIVDKFSREEIKLGKNIAGRNLDIHYVEKAEQYLGVAAASIIARDEFNNWFKRLEFELPKGANNGIEGALRKLVENYGANGLANFVKLHFKNIKAFTENIR